MITTHIKKVGYDGQYTGYIKVSDGGASYAIQSGITRIKKHDASRDAVWLAKEYKPSHPFIK